ncbi:hypothetical protein V2J09_004783 [Rumex salicifolius]
MEAFSLLKFWKSSTVAPGGLVTPLPASTTATEEDRTAAGDDGPFFDLEFSGADSDDDEDDVAEVVCVDGDGEEVEVLEESETEEVVKFRVSSSGGSNSERSDPNLPISPSEEDVFKILAVNPGSDNSSGNPEVFPVSLLRSATRLRILMSGFKRSSKPVQAQPDPKQPPQQRKKLFTIKFKPGEVPIVSLFTRDHSSRPLNGVVSSFSSSSSTSSSSSSSSSSKKPDADSEQQLPTSDEKLNPKDKVQKYIKMVKPLYIRVSKKYGEKLRFSGQLNLGTKSPTPEKPSAKSPEEEEAAEKESDKKNQGNLGVGLKVMIKKRLSGKMKSAEAAAHPPPAAAGRRQDDLVQQQEWIQGAILHCKRSFNASRDEESASVLLRSTSDPSHEKTVEENDVVGGR